LLVLAKAAGLTQRMKLVTNVLLAPLYQPVRLLEDLATLDNLSDGRLIFGTSPGYASEEFLGYGVPYAERFAYFEEIIDFIEHGWRNPSNIAFNSKRIKVPPSALMPPPVQPVLPIWYGVSGPKLLVRAACRRAPVTASPRHTIEELQAHFARYKAVAEEAGYMPTERPVIREAFVAGSTVEAERIAGPAVTHLFSLYGKKSAQGQRELRDDRGNLVTSIEQLDFRSFSSRYLIGDIEKTIDDIGRLRAQLAPTELILRTQLPGIPTEELERSIRLVGEKIIPRYDAVS
jgi:alkanesulfonate monooxygenase SsuD/methylene tetrahydromethanopterin reductase-like flavin-dependent oxidoreductase (luciferase family)